MNKWNDGTRWKAGATATLLVLAGAALGVLLDRLWLVPQGAAAMPLTAEALVAHLDLDPEVEAHIRALLDSVHTEVVSAAAENPQAVAEIARGAHQRLEAALPTDARPAFRRWVEDHHAQMIERIQGEATSAPMHTHP